MLSDSLGYSTRLIFILTMKGTTEGLVGMILGLVGIVRL